MQNNWTIILIPLLPLAGFILLGLFGRTTFKTSSGIIGTSLLLASAILVIYSAYDYFSPPHTGGFTKQVPVHFTWLRFSNTLSIDMGILLDPISVMMIVVVTFVSLMVHIYSLA